MLKATDLTKSHDGAPLFDGLSLTLDDGARAALVGVNGVGKTTLLRLLAGVDRPDRGAVALGRARSRRLPAAGRARAGPHDRRPVTPRPGRGVGGEATARCAGGRSARPRRLRPRAGALRGARRLGAGGAAGRGAAPSRHRAPGPRDAARQPVRRRGGALPAGRGAARRTDRPAARRADQPPRRRRPRMAGGVAGRIPRDAADDLARPRLPRRDRAAHLRAVRGRPRGLRGRLHGLSRGARAAPRTARAGDRGAGQVPAPAGGRYRDDVPPGPVHGAHRARARRRRR